RWANAAINRPRSQMPDIGNQNPSRAYLLPVEDTEFLLREELRGTRFMLEYEKAELSLRDWGVRSTIIAFGSARTPSPEQAEAELRTAKGEDAVKRAERRQVLSRYYEEARNFGRIASLRGGALHPDNGLRDNVIATGGGPGIMEAANRGAADAGAPSIGFNISLPHEQGPNPYSTPELTFQFHYFAMRKMHFAMRANALVVFPGGFGTLDELFEILTLEQTRKAPPVPVVLLGLSYWQRVINFDAMVEDGTIAAADLGLFSFVDTAEEAWTELVRRGLKAHTPPEDVPKNGD
ncbi:MAG: 3-isopropylmalate dehydrogenase, partial [Rhodospirillales bacterium]|nr:3-isopropylmalate dehydrogenase [Rhodospirillales bacterium]